MALLSNRLRELARGRRPEDALKISTKEVGQWVKRCPESALCSPTFKMAVDGLTCSAEELEQWAAEVAEAGG